MIFFAKGSPNQPQPIMLIFLFIVIQPIKIL
jgi:hypothetical protein